MKRLSTYVIAFIISFSALFAEDIEIILGEGYENDLWFHFDNGIVKAEPKDNWDIAVQTGAKDAGIRTNSQKGVNLWVIEGSDGDSWKEDIDTTGMTENWREGHNSTETWSIGAFNLGLDGFQNDGDFGWGMYNMATHSVSGNKVFLIKLADETYKKIMIESLLHGAYTIKWANIDGSNEQKAEVKKSDFNEKLFAYIDLSTGEVLDREPPADSWALLFGKYTAMISMGPQTVPYAVTGVRTNPLYRTAKISDVPAEQAVAPDLNEENYLENITEIGSDWKKLDHETFTYNIVENLSYFVTSDDSQSPNPRIDKIVFKEFEGSSTGRLVFRVNGGINSIKKITQKEFQIFPNIAERNSIINISFSNWNLSGDYDILLLDRNGSEIIKKSIKGAAANDRLQFTVPSSSAGLYFLGFKTRSGFYAAKLIIK